MPVRSDASGDALGWSANLPSETSFSACGWAKYNAISATLNNVIFAIGDTGAAAITVTVFPAATALTVYANGNQVNTITIPAAGVWFWWAVTCAGTGANQVAAYGANLADVTLTTATTTLAGAFTEVSCDLFRFPPFPTEFWDGSAFAFKLWDVALTQTELEMERRFVLPRRRANLRYFVPLRTAADVLDHSGNGFNPTVSGLTDDLAFPPTSWGLRNNTPRYTPRKRGVNSYSFPKLPLRGSAVQ